MGTGSLPLLLLLPDVVPHLVGQSEGLAAPVAVLLGGVVAHIGRAVGVMDMQQPAAALKHDPPELLEALRVGRAVALLAADLGVLARVLERLVDEGVLEKVRGRWDTMYRLKRSGGSEKDGQEEAL